MNVLKKFKVVFLSVLAFMFTLTAVSCNNNKAPERTGITDDDESFTTAKANVSEDGFNFDTAILSSIDIDVSKAKTTFFLGESFSSEGVVVKANFLATVDGERKSESFTTTDFSIDTSEVDMYNIGTYPVEVTYRYKATVNKKTYNVNVISSELAASGEEYVGGIDVKYNGELEYTIDLGQTFNSNVNKFTVIQHTFTGYEETGSKTISTNKYSTDGSTPVKIDASAVNSAVRGDYVVKVEYTPDEVVVDGKTLTYKVKAFIIVHVIDTITNVSFVSGTRTFSATAGDFDYSDWTFEVTRKNSGKSTVKYNDVDFKLTGIVSFITGDQTAELHYMDYEFSLMVDIVVTASDTYNITKGNIYDMEYNTNNELVCVPDTVWSSNIEKTTKDTYLDDSHIFKINLPSGYATDRFNSSKSISKDSYGALYFGHRVTIKGTDSYISVKMDNPGVLVIYAASTGGGQRDINVYDGVNLSGNEVGVKYTSETKQQITQLVFKVEKAGTYYIQSFDSAYIHGIVVAVAK